MPYSVKVKYELKDGSFVFKNDPLSERKITLQPKGKGELEQPNMGKNVQVMLARSIHQAPDSDAVFKNANMLIGYLSKLPADVIVNAYYDNYDKITCKVDSTKVVKTHSMAVKDILSRLQASLKSAGNKLTPEVKNALPVATLHNYAIPDPTQAASGKRTRQPVAMEWTL